MDCPKRSTPAGLPYDAIVEILARLPARSVHRFKCVAKAWRDLIDDPLNRKKLPQTLEGLFFIDQPIDEGSIVEHFDFLNLLPRSVPLDIDPRFSFLTTGLPEIEDLVFADSCNGLFLFHHVRMSDSFDMLGYIVCNPATKQWKTVPTCSCCPPITEFSQLYTFLAFDPAVSSHFHLIHIWKEDLDDDVEPLEDQMFVFWLCAYSSETGTWGQSQPDWNEQGQLEGWRHQGSLVDYKGPQHVYINGTMHLIVRDLDQHQDQIVALDVKGKTKRIITVPAAAEGKSWHFIGYIGQSQGCLHYINNGVDAHDPKESYELSIWVLRDYDTQEWVLKDTVSFMKLFGIMSCGKGRSDFFMVAIHQDCNVVFFLQPWNRLISYDMDSKEVSVIATFDHDLWDARIAPYTPCFSESMALTNKH